MYFLFAKRDSHLPLGPGGPHASHFRLRFETVIMIFMGMIHMVHPVGVKLGLELLEAGLAGSSALSRVH